MAEIVPVSTDGLDQRLLKQVLYSKTHRQVREQYSLRVCWCTTSSWLLRKCDLRLLSCTSKTPFLLYFIYLAWAENFTVKKCQKLHYSPLYSSDKGYGVKVLKPQALRSPSCYSLIIFHSAIALKYLNTQNMLPLETLWCLTVSIAVSSYVSCNGLPCPSLKISFRMRF